MCFGSPAIQPSLLTAFQQYSKKMPRRSVPLGILLGRGDNQKGFVL